MAKALASEAFRPDRDRAMTIRYDPSEYPLLDAFCDLVGERHLATVHERWRAHDRGQSHLEEKRALLSPLAVPSAKRDAFEEVYDRLVREVVLPAIAERQRKHLDAAETCTRQYLYAAFPCARVQQPSRFHTIRCHVDAMYGHGPCSVNCWLPLTALDARGLNSLHVESEPGAEDFRDKVRARVGAIAPDGSACARYTVANESDETEMEAGLRARDAAGVARSRRARWKETPIDPVERNARRGTAWAATFPPPRPTRAARSAAPARGAPCGKHGFPHSDGERVGPDENAV